MRPLLLKRKSPDSNVLAGYLITRGFTGYITTRFFTPVL